MGACLKNEVKVLKSYLMTLDLCRFISAVSCVGLKMRAALAQDSDAYLTINPAQQDSYTLMSTLGDVYRVVCVQLKNRYLQAPAY